MKESVQFLAPIFITFVATHALLLGYGFFSHIPTGACRGGRIPPASGHRPEDDGRVRHARPSPARFLPGRRYLYGHRGRVERPADHARAEGATGKRTMLYMATSLAITAGGLFICYSFQDNARRGQDAQRRPRRVRSSVNWPLGYWLASLPYSPRGRS